MHLSKSTARKALGFAVLVFACTTALAQSDQFTIIALPDTQFYSESYPQIFNANMQWVANNAAAMNIKYVAGLGDIVNVGSSATEWQNADNAVRLLDQAGIPYGMAIGNHDYDGSAVDTSTRKTVNFNKWFGPNRYSAYSWYGSSNYPAGSNENFYTVININGINYMFLNLEFYPRNAALQWAAGVLQANQDKKVVVVTHGYGNSDNYRMGTCDVSGPVSYNIPNDNDGDMMWNKLVSQYSNIVMVLSGHMSNAGHQVDFGVNGNLVNEMMSAHYNLTDPNGGNGYLRILTITPSQNRIDAKTYSPYANLYKTDGANQFSLTYQGTPSGTVAGQAKIRGRIRNTSCAAITGATASYQSTTNGQTTGSVKVDGSGYYSANVPSPANYTVSAAGSGYSTATASVPVMDGYAVPARFILSTAPTDFTIATTPATQTVVQGSTATYTTTVSATGGFTGTVALTATGLPTGATATFSPSSITGSGTATLGVVPASNTPAGTYPITITGTSGTTQHTSQASLTVSTAAADFSMSVSPATGTVSPGQSATYTPAITANNGFSDTVTLSLSGLPAGASATFSPTTLSGSGSSTLTIVTSSSTPAGTYPLTITGTAPSAQHTIQATLIVGGTADFNIATSPASQTVTQGGNATYSATISAVNGFAGAVTFAASGLPAGATASFSPTSVSGSGSSTLTVSTTSSTPAGTYPLTVTATSGALQHTGQVSLVVTTAVAPADFTIAATPASQTAAQGDSANYSATISAINGFAGVVTFTASGLPTGAAASFNAASLTGSGSSTLTVSTNSSTPAGTYPLTITATSGSLQHTAQVSLVVSGTADFNIATSPASQTVTQGGTATYSATISAVNGFTAAVTFAASGLPTGATVSFSPTSVSGSGSSAMTVSTTSSTPAGTYPLTVTATSGTLQHTAQASLVVSGTADFNIATTPASQTVTQGGNATYSATISAVNGFTGAVTFAASGLPTGATASFSPTSVSGAGSSAITVITTASTPAGTYPITITATSGTLQHTAQVSLVVSGTADFNIATSPASQTVTQGGTVTYSATISAVNGFTGAVTFAASGLPSGATASFSPTSVSGSGSSAMTVTTTASTPAGTYPITISATSGALQHAAQVSLVVSGTSSSDFSLASVPTLRTIAQNAYNSYSLTVSALNGFTGAVTFAASGLPAGATATFSPSTVTGKGSTSMLLSCTGVAVAGNYTVSVLATSGSIRHTITVTLAVTGFSLSVSPTSQNVVRGSVASYTETVTDLNGYSASETLSVTGLPTAATATFASNPIVGSGTSTMTIQTGATTPKGTYTLTVKATSSVGSLYHTFPVSMTVQ